MIPHSNSLSIVRILVMAVLLRGPELYAQSLSPCAYGKPLHVVVLGSSTAAGAGPSHPDSTWVNKYRNYLQAIHPASQVTNLAIGGTTTYHIMPDWYIAPPNRPATNPNNNVTQAVTLGADGIIVNMPSNDAGNSFGVGEQMANFTTISQHADSAGIAVWICTTQPRNFSASQKAIQVAVRDSIFATFGMFAIDFWNGIADSTDGILPFFDSGDGVHLNDAGHALLVSRVIAENIPEVLSDTLPFTDHAMVRLYADGIPLCGDSNTAIHAVVVNAGLAATAPADVVFAIDDQSNMWDTTLTGTGALSACTADTVTLLVNTYDGASLQVHAYLDAADSIKANDTSQVIGIYTTGHPSITVTNDTVCTGDSALLAAMTTQPGDTVAWYDAAAGGNLLGFGPSFATGSLTAGLTRYAEAVRGPLHFRKSLLTTTATTTNWNGIMFDISAIDSLVIDSLDMKLNSTGLQAITAWQRSGSHAGFENDSLAWNLWDTLFVQATTAGEFVSLDLPDAALAAGDTLGVYLHLQDAGSTLSYQALPNPIVTADARIRVHSGSGIAHTFGQVYTPRNFSGTVYYHYGFNAGGDCVSPRKPVHALLSEPAVDLGADTMLLLSQLLALNAGPGYASYLWSTGDTAMQVVIDTTGNGAGTQAIWVVVTDVFGCTGTDTIMVTFSPQTGTRPDREAAVSVYPNPTDGMLMLSGPPYMNGFLSVYDQAGRLLYSRIAIPGGIDLTHLGPGAYLLQIEGRWPFRRIVLIR